MRKSASISSGLVAPAVEEAGKGRGLAFEGRSLGRSARRCQSVGRQPASRAALGFAIRVHGHLCRRVGFGAMRLTCALALAACARGLWLSSWSLAAAGLAAARDFWSASATFLASSSAFFSAAASFFSAASPPLSRVQASLASSSSV